MTTTNMTPERLAEIEEKLVAYKFTDNLGHPLHSCIEFQALLAEVHRLQGELVKAEKGKEVLADIFSNLASLLSKLA